MGTQYGNSGWNEGERAPEFHTVQAFALQSGGGRLYSVHAVHAVLTRRCSYLVVAILARIIRVLLTAHKKKSVQHTCFKALGIACWLFSLRMTGRDLTQVDNQVDCAPPQLGGSAGLHARRP